MFIYCPGSDLARWPLYHHLLDRTGFPPEPAGLHPELARGYRATVFFLSGASYLAENILNERPFYSDAETLQRGLLKADRTLAELEWAWAAWRDGKAIRYWRGEFPSPLTAAKAATRRVLDKLADAMTPCGITSPGWKADFLLWDWECGVINKKDLSAWFGWDCEDVLKQNPSPVLTEAIQDLCRKFLGHTSQGPILLPGPAGTQPRSARLGSDGLSTAVSRLRADVNKLTGDIDWLERVVEEGPAGLRAGPIRNIVPAEDLDVGPHSDTDVDPHRQADRLSEAESAVAKVLAGGKILQGPELAAGAGYVYDYVRRICSRMERHGLLTNDRKNGYRLTDKGERLYLQFISDSGF
jgi:hypothetical protein